MKELVVTEESYFAMVEELNALKTEESFDFGVRHVQWAWLWGKTIRDYLPSGPKEHVGRGHPSKAKYESTLQKLSLDVGRNVRTLRDYIKLFDLHPQLEDSLAQHGKSVSLRKMIGETEHEGTPERQQQIYLQSLTRNLNKLLMEPLTKRECEAATVVLEATERLLG